MIEKAYAKAHVNYEMISSGTHGEAVAFLTGAPSHEFKTSVASVDDIWQSVTEAVMSNNLVTAVCYTEWQGLVAGHGYIIKDFLNLPNPDGSSTRLIKVRNPWK